MSRVLTALRKRARQMQPPPVVIGALLEAIADPNHSLSDLERILKLDPTLSARLLKLVNSPAYLRRGGEVHSIGAAVSVLGEALLVRFVVGASAQCVRVCDVPGYELQNYGLWKQSIRAAVASEAIAKMTKRVAPGLAYASGLLLDIGKLVVGPELADLLPNLLESWDLEPEATFDQLERDAVGLDHAEVGARIAEKWRLPASIVTAIRYHHRPKLADSHQALVAVVHAGATVSLLPGITESVDGLGYSVDQETVDGLSLGQEEIEHLILTSECEVAEAERLLDAA